MRYPASEKTEIIRLQRLEAAMARLKCSAPGLGGQNRGHCFPSSTAREGL